MSRAPDKAPAAQRQISIAEPCRGGFCRARVGLLSPILRADFLQRGKASSGAYCYQRHGGVSEDDVRPTCGVSCHNPLRRMYMYNEPPWCIRNYITDCTTCPPTLSAMRLRSAGSVRQHRRHDHGGRRREGLRRNHQRRYPP